MSILIKGMDMPKNCAECPCWQTEPKYKGNVFFVACDCCQANHEEIDNIYVKPKTCPLVEIPAHGGLVEKVEMLKALRRICNKCTAEYQKQCEEMPVTRDCRACIVDAERVRINTKKPVIEAES